MAQTTTPTLTDAAQRGYLTAVGAVHAERPRIDVELALRPQTEGYTECDTNQIDVEVVADNPCTNCGAECTPRSYRNRGSFLVFACCYSCGTVEAF